jgi:hypothetical protein
VPALQIELEPILFKANIKACHGDGCATSASSTPATAFRILSSILFAHFARQASPALRV